MSKKSHSYDVLGDKRCIKCNKRLKKRIELEKPNFNKCYRCFKGLPALNDTIEEHSHDR